MKNSFFLSTKIIILTATTSQVTYVTMVPRVGNETLRPLGVAMGNAISVYDDVFSRCPLYCGRPSSDVIGCRRPTGGVFICMLQTRVTLMAFHIATPRGRSSKFPWRGTDSWKLFHNVLDIILKCLSFLFYFPFNLSFFPTVVYFSSVQRELRRCPGCEC